MQDVERVEIWHERGDLLEKHCRHGGTDVRTH